MTVTIEKNTSTNPTINPFNIHVSDQAAERMKTFLNNRGKGIGIRLGVQTAGCSGMAYVIEFVDELAADDRVTAVNGVNIIINTKAAIYLQGISIDYQKQGLNEGFKFENPNATGECGCGESFTV